MENDSMPLWRRMAIEQGAIKESGTPTEVEVPEKSVTERGEKESAPVRRRRVSTKIYGDTLPILRRLASYIGVSEPSTYADIIERLALDRMEEYSEVERILEDLRR